MSGFQNGRQFDIDDRESWSSLFPECGTIMEVSMQHTIAALVQREKSGPPSTLQALQPAWMVQSISQLSSWVAKMRQQEES